MLNRILLSAVALATVVSAQEPVSEFAVPGTQTRVGILSEGGKLFSAVRRGEGAWLRQSEIDHKLHLSFGSFDPKNPPMIPGALRADASNRLFAVQFQTQIISEFRAVLRGMGATIHQFLPSQSYLVRMDSSRRAAIEALPFVRSVIAYHPAFRLHPQLIVNKNDNPDTSSRYAVLIVDKRADALGLEERARQLGAEKMLASKGGILFEATMTQSQMLQLANDSRTLWIESCGAIEVDIDQARIQSGSNYVETQAGIAGIGMTGHVLEGVYRTHPEFAAIAGVRSAPIAPFDGTGAGHGNSTAGEIYGRGANPTYRGLMPNAQLVYTNYSYVINKSTRYPMTTSLIANQRIMLETASWGYGRTVDYTARSVEMDEILFDHDIFITQSQSNAGGTSNPRMSRPQAWAKNICSVGGFRHGNNSNAADDYWGRSGSTGPASDGRIGVTLSAYYDSIGTTSGTSGYTTSFGGTSGATPIINGIGGNMIEMFTDGLFGYGKTAAKTAVERTKVLPHFTTTKALLSATAKQVTWNATGITTGANRYQQGFGFPDLSRAYDERNRMLVIDEIDVLQQRQSRSYWLFAKGGRLNAAMNYRDPAGVATTNSSAKHRVNSVDLKVETADGKVYHGNNGLTAGAYSVAGGVPNDLDTEEAVLLARAPRGVTTVTVSATGVRTDAHKETRAVDVDYALVVDGTIGMRDRTALALDLKSVRTGDLRVEASNLPASGWDEGFTLFSAAVGRPVSTGNLFGLEFDAISRSLLKEPIAAGSVFHFRPGSSTQFPQAEFAFPKPFIAVLQGVSFDAVMILFNRGEVVNVSNVDRVTIR